MRFSFRAVLSLTLQTDTKKSPATQAISSVSSRGCLDAPSIHPRYYTKPTQTRAPPILRHAYTVQSPPPLQCCYKAQKALAIFNFVKGEAGEIDKRSNFFLTILSGVNVQKVPKVNHDPGHVPRDFSPTAAILENEKTRRPWGVPWGT